jgi:uncharacterized protein (DUF2267 family)
VFLKNNGNIMSLPSDQPPDNLDPLDRWLPVAADIRATGKASLDVLLELSHRMLRAGETTPALHVLRRLPGGEECDPLAELPNRLRGLPANGLDDEPDPDSPPDPTQEEVRERKRGERLMERMRRHKDLLRPVLLDLIAEDVGELVGQLVAVGRAHHG